jgi:hypothetical protein
MRMNIELRIGAAIVATLALVSAADTRAQTAEPHTAQPPSPQAQSPSDAPGLHNVVAFGPGCWSGSLPEGDAGFASLQSWGVRTVISVDGAVPDVARAARFGLRYVHLPIGYDGFDEARKLELVRAVRDLPGPIYIHCHHGKHRSAGAAAAVAASLGWMSPQAAIARMKVSGTSESYPGLYRCASTAQVLAASLIDTAPAQWPAVTRPSGMVESMVAIDDALERIKVVEQAGWKVPASHPDLAPAADAGAIADHLRLLGQQPSARPRDPQFDTLLQASMKAADQLESSLVGTPTADAQRLANDLQALRATCTACHAAQRDRRRMPDASPSHGGPPTAPPPPGNSTPSPSK